jgi:Domain of unknown function (DUF4440)
MKQTTVAASILIAVLLFMSCSTQSHSLYRDMKKYQPASQALYDTILHFDSVFFHAYNTCDLELQGQFYSDEIEFYHDKGGLMTSKSEILEGTRKNICGKVTRELITGSMEVYPIHGFGAISMGLHRFHNSSPDDAGISRPSKFIIIWHQIEERWEITTVVSLH